MRYFTAAAEDLSMSKAAARLHVTQPALSRQIGVLESELGVALFERVKGRIHLSEAGRFFLPRARQILCDAETLAQLARERFGGARRTLRLGFLTPFLDDLIAPTVRSFRTEHPDVNVSLFELPPQAQLDRLRAGELDAALLGNIDERHRELFSLRKVSRHRMAAILPSDHPLAGRKSVRLAELKNDGWVSLAEAFFPGRREFLLRTTQDHGFEPRIVSEVDSLTLLLGAVASGDGVAILPGHCRKLPHQGAVFVKLAPPVPVSELLLVTLKRPLPAPLKSLTEMLANAAARLADG